MDWSHYTILIVEDDMASKLYFETILESSNINMIHVNNGIGAFAECLRNDNIDVVLMDLKIPGLDGFETTRLIKKYRPTIPVIGQSAFAADFIKDRCLQFGCSDFISKPIIPHELYSVLKAYISAFNSMKYYIQALNTNN
jgi:CheY-like chemotaxis protein